MKKILVFLTVFLIASSSYAIGPTITGGGMGADVVSVAETGDALTVSNVAGAVDISAQAMLEAIADSNLTSANLQTILTNESGTGAALMQTSNFMAATIQAFGADDATPDVSLAATKVNNFYQTANANPTTITDFDDGAGDAHDEYVNGSSFFLLRVDDANTTIDFSANANIEGNAGIDFTGSATQIVYILFVFEDSRWNAVNFQIGMSSPTALGIASIDLQSGTIQGAMKVGAADADGEVLAAATMNSIRISSGAGDWTIPDVCDSATGYWVKVVANAAHVASLDLAGDEDLFILSNGTALHADDELDTAGGAWDSCTVTCVATDTWMVTGENGTCADGGVSD